MPMPKLIPTPTPASITEPVAARARPAATEHGLAPGALCVLDGSAALQLTVLQGRLWVTCSGDADDHFLQAGAVWRPGRRGRLVLENDGAGPARFRLDTGPGAPAARAAQPSMSAQIVRAQPQA